MGHGAGHWRIGSLALWHFNQWGAADDSSRKQKGPVGFPTGPYNLRVSECVSDGDCAFLRFQEARSYLFCHRLILHFRIFRD